MSKRESIISSELKQEVSQSLRSLRIERYKLVRNILIGFIVISVLNIIVSHTLYTPKMYSIWRHNRELISRYAILQDKVRTLQSQVNEIHHRDRNIYRSLFSADSIAIEGIYTPYPDTKYAEFLDDDYSALIGYTWHDMDALAREVYAQSVSLDQLQTLALNKENMSQAIPAIWPIDRSQLRAFYGFGVRVTHPIFGTRKMHKGVDLAGRVGINIYATGDGTVEITDNGLRSRGYGKQIVLNHQFGYKTRYAHLNKILVKEGEQVKRGQIIGELGSTGGSTGPHLHYEVLYMGRNVNPVNYFNRNMTAEEYQTMMENIRSDADLEVKE